MSGRDSLCPVSSFYRLRLWTHDLSIGQKTILMNLFTVLNIQNLRKIIAEIQTTMKRAHGVIQQIHISASNIVIYQNVARLGGISI